MKKLQKTVIMFIIAAIAILPSLPVNAAKDIYKAGIINDYYFSGNEIVPYAKTCLTDAFLYIDNSGLDFFEYTLDDGIKALNSGSLNFLSMVPMDEKLKSAVDYTDKPIAMGFLTLLTEKDRELYFEDFKKLDGARIAILNGSAFEPMLLEYASEKGFNYVAAYYDSMEDMYDAVMTGQADAMLTPATTSPDNMRLIAKCGSFDYYCAARKGDGETLDMLNGMLNSLNDDKPFYLSEWYSASYRIPYHNMVALTEDDYNAVKVQEKLRVFASDNNYPMSYYSVSDSAYEGVYIEIVEQIANNAGLEVEYVPDDTNDMEATLNSIVLGKADVILAVSGSKQGLIEATDPYTTLSFLPITRKNRDIDENAVLHVGVVSGDVWISEYLEENRPQWQVKEYHSINAMLFAAAHNKIDMALVSSTDMQTKTSLIAHPALEINDGFTVDVPVCLGISKVTCRQQVVNMLNGIIQNTTVSEQELEGRIYTLSHTYVPNFRDMIYANKIWIIVILLIIAAVFVYIKRREGYFKELARTDNLTHIYNGRYFTKAAEEVMSKNPDKPYLLGSLDAKNFKLINDRFGTVIGDQTLVNIASKIRNIFRNKGLYARLQADCFVILAEDTEENRALFEELEKMDVHIHDSTNYHVLIKTGICPIAKYEKNVPLSGYIDKANIAKEDSPGTNTNYLRYFTDEMASQLDTKNNIEIDMVPALRRGDFIVYYQPKYNLDDDKIIGAEALVRWYHKEKGLIPPGIFVPLFEKNGFIVEVDFNVYELVLKMLKKRLDRDRKVVKVSMNVSRCHLSDPKFVDRLEALIDKYKVPKEYIEMEITESIFSEGDNSAFSLVYELKRRGFSVSMDDFGSGYSSLNLLRKMPIDTLKIDKVFIDDIETSERSQYIVEEIIQMAKRIDVSTICEGVETETQRDMLKSAGCDMVQGYFYSRPLPGEEFETLLDAN